MNEGCSSQVSPPAEISEIVSRSHIRIRRLFFNFNSWVLSWISCFSEASETTRIEQNFENIVIDSTLVNGVREVS